MSKPVSLSVHRNTKLQRARHSASRHLKGAIQKHVKQKQIEGYVLVSWDQYMRATASWHNGNVREIPVNLLGEMAKVTINRTLSQIDMEEFHGLIPPEDEDA